MRNLIFLFPCLSMQSGGHLAQWRFLKVFQKIVPAIPATYQAPEEGAPFLDDLLQAKPNSDDVFVIHWGPHIPALLSRLKGRNVVYFAHSVGWGFQLPPEIPVIAVSRNTQSYWGRETPNQFIMRLPNVIGEEFTSKGMVRDIDVLIQRRKSSPYLLDVLAPRLEKRCQVTILNDWVKDLSEYLNRAKIYLYDSTDHWANMNASEGFGLPPLEAIACGCTVFSSVNDSLSDYLDPGFNCYKLRSYSTEFDCTRILDAVENFSPASPEALIEDYREPSVLSRTKVVVSEINKFFDHQNCNAPDLPSRNTQTPRVNPLNKLRAYARSGVRQIGQYLRQ